MSRRKNSNGHSGKQFFLPSGYVERLVCACFENLVEISHGRVWLRNSCRRKRAGNSPLPIHSQKVNRAPNWNWRGVLSVFVICPKFAELGGVDPFTNVMLGMFGYPNCALFGRL